MKELISAVVSNDIIKTKKALKNVENINQSLDMEDDDNIFFLAIKHKVDIEILRLLVDSGLDIDYANELGVGILDEAINCGDLEFIKYLVEEKGLNPIVTKRKSGFTPLMQAVSYGFIDIVKYLLQNGADMEQKDNFGFTPKDYARKLGQIKVLDYLNSL